LIEAISSTNTASEKSEPFGERNIFAELIELADLAFEVEGDGAVINLRQPHYVHWMPISELDGMLAKVAKPGFRAELAVVVIGQWRGRVPTKGEAKMMEEFASRTREGKTIDESAYWVGEGETMEEFASRVNEKLRKAGFKQVIFANNYNGFYHRMSVGRTPTKEEAQKERALTDFAAEESAVKALQGAWIPKAVLGAQPCSEDILKKMTLILTNLNYEVTITGEQSDCGTWSLDTSGNPRGMTIIGTKGPNAGRTFPCIYEIDGDTLRICYALSGAERPTEFKTTAGANLYLVIYNRKK
jgi:uncharacterized protein (TIGR03067 family)